MVMGLYWLSGNGFTQVAPAVYTNQDGAVVCRVYGTGLQY